jgi:ribosome maturation protein Sdo1
MKFIDTTFTFQDDDDEYVEITQEQLDKVQKLKKREILNYARRNKIPTQSSVHPQPENQSPLESRK